MYLVYCTLNFVHIYTVRSIKVKNFKTTFMQFISVYAVKKHIVYQWWLDSQLLKYNGSVYTAQFQCFMFIWPFKITSRLPIPLCYRSHCTIHTHLQRQITLYELISVYFLYLVSPSTLAGVYRNFLFLPKYLFYSSFSPSWFRS